MIFNETNQWKSKQPEKFWHTVKESLKYDIYRFRFTEWRKKAKL